MVELLADLLQHLHDRAAPVHVVLAPAPVLPGQEPPPPLVPGPGPVQWSRHHLQSNQTSPPSQLRSYKVDSISVNIRIFMYLIIKIHTEIYPSLNEDRVTDVEVLLDLDPGVLLS